MTAPSWPITELIETARLTLEPLRVDHADELAPVLADLRLYTFIGGRPPTRELLRSRYTTQVVGHSPDGQQGWLNWVLRRRDTGEAVGTVQATISQYGQRRVAELAWVVAVAHQRRGYAQEAATAVAGWLYRQGVDTLVAHIHPAHEASTAIARRLGLRATEETVDGETRWTTEPIVRTS